MKRIINKIVLLMLIISNFLMSSVDAGVSQDMDHAHLRIIEVYEIPGSDHWRLDYFHESETFHLEEMRVFINEAFVEIVYPQWLKKTEDYDINNGIKTYDMFKIEFSLFKNVYEFDNDSGYYKDYSVMDKYRDFLTDDEIEYFESEKNRPDPINKNNFEHSNRSFETFTFELIFKDSQGAYKVHTISKDEIHGSINTIVKFEDRIVDEIQTGYQNQWIEIQGKSFYFDDEGRLVKSSWQKQENQSWKYIKIDGTAAVSEFLELNDKAYYFNETGTMITNNWKLIEDPNDHTSAWYYFDSDGAAKVNEWIGSSKAWYYIKSDGKAAQNEWYKVSGHWYYFDETTRMINNGWKQIDKYWYYFNNNGSLKINAWIGNSNAWYYVKSGGEAAQNEWQKISGRWYFFDDTTKMVSNNWRLINNNWYFFGSNGAMLSSEWKSSGRDWYYLKSSGAASRNEWKKIGNSWYFFDSSTKMVTGWKQLDGNWYYFNSSGSMQTNTWINTAQGWYYLEANGTATKTNTLDFNNCTELKEIYPEGVSKSHPAYKPKLDRDKDGWACEISGDQKG